MKTIPVIDLFAGPGGLGEGFSANSTDDYCFKIKLSIEKDRYAHETLLLRSFFRKFTQNKKPKEYYDYITGGANICLRELYEKYPNEFSEANNEALCLELGKDNEKISCKINEVLKNEISGDNPWVLIGGPPCQAYSIAGRSRNKSKKGWSLETDSRSTLYKEYLMIIAKYQPAVFVMENVKGLLSANYKNQKMIDKVLSDLKNPNKISNKHAGASHMSEYLLFSLTTNIDYDSDEINPKDFIIKSEEYGVPQKRHRIIILGVRRDYFKGDSISLLKKSTKPVCVKDVLCDLSPLESSFSNRINKLSKFDKIIISNNFLTTKDIVKWYYSQQLISDMKVKIEFKKNLSLLNNSTERNTNKIQYNKKWFYDKKLKAKICNHDARTHMRSDLIRYFYASCYAKVYGVSPKLRDFPDSLQPNHSNIKSGAFPDRFRVQVESQPSTTITSHISKDGHYYIHPDPAQCRSLTVREAARLQTFPDNYYFCGNRTQQYHQVGNAVPPYLAYQIASVVLKVLSNA